MRTLNGRDHVIPVIGWRPLPCTTTPRAFEDLVQQKHGHVATDSIALSRNTGDSFNRCLPKPGLKRIELQNVWPCRKVRVPSAGVDASLYLNVGCRVVSGFLGSSAKEVLYVLDDPRVIRCYMVRHEIQEQLHVSFRELSPGNGETFRTSQVCVNHVASYAVGRSDIIFQPKIG